MWSLLLSLALLAGGAPASPDVPREVTEKVNTYLSTIDTPISAERWRSLGEPGVVALEQIARSPRALPTRRARAVGAAGLIGGARARTLALDLSRAQGAPPVVRQSAIRALGVLLSSAELSSTLGPILRGAPRLSLRATAANVLADHAPRSCEGIRAQVQREPAPRRSAFGAALARCGPAH